MTSTAAAMAIATASTPAATAAVPSQLTSGSHGSAAKKIKSTATTSYRRSSTTVPVISTGEAELRCVRTSTRAGSPARAGRMLL